MKDISFEALLIEYGNTISAMRDYENANDTFCKRYDNLSDKAHAIEEEARRRDTLRLSSGDTLYRML
jgi:hypothetical protein